MQDIRRCFSSAASYLLNVSDSWDSNTALYDNWWNHGRQGCTTDALPALYGRNGPSTCSQFLAPSRSPSPKRKYAEPKLYFSLLSWLITLFNALTVSFVVHRAVCRNPPPCLVRRMQQPHEMGPLKLLLKKKHLFHNSRFLMLFWDQQVPLDTSFFVGRIRRGTASI